MSSPYVGEIRMFGGNFAPAGWAFCQGQVLPISQNETLFNLIGTTYGGDGQNTFALPNLAGRLPIHMGQGPGISQNYVEGESGGVESVTLTTQQIPSHNHAFVASTSAATAASPANGLFGATVSAPFWFNGPVDSSFNAATVQNTGGSQPHENMMPTLCVSFILSLFGVFPSPT